MERFPEINVHLEPSDQKSIFSFLGQIDVLISVAEYEGFGRPIACALKAGVPCYLLESPVFLEFFSGGAHFFKDIHSMLDHLLKAWSGPGLPEVHLQFPAPVLEGFSEALALLDESAVGCEGAEN
jgi:hypothetical protein